LRRWATNPDEPSPADQSPRADALPGRTSHFPVIRRPPGPAWSSSRSPPDGPKVTRPCPARGPSLPRAIRRPPEFRPARGAFLRPADPKVSRPSPGSWSRPAPGDPKITWPGPAPSTHRSRSSTGISTTG